MEKPFITKKQSIIAAVAAVIVLIILIGFHGFWKLGETTIEAYPNVSIKPISGKVEWRRQGETDWKQLKAMADLLPGDEVRTLDAGEASLVWGDQGETRLQPNSTMLIEAAPSSGQAATGRVIRLRVESGRVWSRFMKVLDLNSKIETRMGDVVATVRGTAFGVANEKGPEVAVTDSVVTVGLPNSQPTFVREGMWGSFTASGTPITVRNLTSADKWASDQSKQDAQNWQEWKNEVEQSLRRLEARRPTGPTGLTQWSKGFHLALTEGGKREEIEAAYLNSELAHRWLNNRDLNGLKLELPRNTQARERAIWQVQRYLKLAQLDQSHQSWIPTLQAWRRTLFSGNPVEAFYIQIIELDEEVDVAILPGTLAEALRARPDTIQSLRKRLADLELSLEKQGNIDEAGKQSLRSRMEAIEERLDINLQPAAPAVVPDQTPTSTTPILTVPPITTKPGTKPTAQPSQPSQPTQPSSQPTQPSPAQPTAQPVYAKVTLFATPTTVNIGNRVSLRMMATRPDGTSEDVTGRTSFSAGRPTDGSVSENIFIPSQAGSPTLFGVLMDNGVSQVASTVVNVGKGAAAKTFTSIALRVPITSAPCNTRLSYTVIANYADGTSQDVTISSSMSVSDPKILLFSGDQLFTGCSNVQTTASLFASYTENGVNKTASQAITVIPDQNTGPSKPGGRKIPTSYVP